MGLPNSFVGEKVAKVLESMGKVCIFAAKGCENGRSSESPLDLWSLARQEHACTIGRVATDEGKANGQLNLFCTVLATCEN